MASSTSNISFSGLSSGIDTASIIQAMVTARSQPILSMQSQRSALQTKRSAYSTLSSQLTAIEGLSKELDNLSDVTFSSGSLGEEFRSLTATSSNTALFTAQVDSARGVTGTHSVTVDRLAKVAVSTAGNGNGASFASTDAAIATGTLKITTGGTTTNITINSSNATLTGVRDAINSSGAAVRATTIYDGTGYKLVVTGTKTGATNGVTIDASGLDQGDLAKTLSFSTTQAAANSRVIVDGVAIEHADNVVEDALYGVTLTLNTESATQATLSVDTNVSGVKASISSFVAAYNTAVGNIRSQNTYTAGQTTTTPPLFGDSLVRGLQAAMAQAVSDPVTGTTTYKMLADVGIHLDKDGSLSIDDAKLSDALTNNFDSVRALFISKDGNDGVAARVTKLVDAYVNSSTGYIGDVQDSIDDQVDDLDDRIDSANRALEDYQTTLTQQFLAMESTISALKGQQTSLQAIFGLN